MASTIVFYHDQSNATLLLRLNNLAGEMVNGTDADVLLEGDPIGKPLRYEATVDESLAGQRLIAQVSDETGPISTGIVTITAEEGSFVIDDLAQLRDLATLEVTLPETFTVGTEVQSFSADALAQLAGTRQIQVAIPTLSGRTLTAPLIQGDSYLAERGRAIEFSRVDFPDIPAGSQARLGARLLDDETVSFSISGEIAVASGVKVLRFEPTTLQTRAWVPGKYQFDVDVVFPDGNVATFVGPDVFLRVLADISL
jgi:hypothetical protein